jgi:hypothetical protein
MMNVDELINLLEEFEPEAEVLIAFQPGDPVESAIEGTVNDEELGKEGVVYLVEGDNLGNAPSDIWMLV